MPLAIGTTAPSQVSRVRIPLGLAWREASEARDVPRGNRTEAGYQLCFFKEDERRETQWDNKIRQRVSAELQAGGGGAARKPGSCLSGRCRGRRPWSAGPGREGGSGSNEREKFLLSVYINPLRSK